VVDYVYSSKEVWRAVYEELKQRGFSLKRIRSEIGCDFSHAVYQGYGIRHDSFILLKKLLGKKIEPVEYRKKKEDIRAEYTEDFAELVGIILGDGNIGRRTVQISVGTRYGELYIEYVKRLIARVLPEVKIGEYHKSDCNAVDLKIHSASFVRQLMEDGLKIGDKKENQISVPHWIEENEVYSLRCFRGLLDTDGSIYKNTRDGQIVVEIKNNSRPLLQFSEEFCRRIGVKMNLYDRNCAVYKKADVRRLLRRVEPRKMSFDQVSPSLSGEQLNEFLNED